jgi:hypothetical protein
MRSVVGIGNHGVGGHDNATLSSKLENYRLRVQSKPMRTKPHFFLLVSGKNSNLTISDIGPLHKLLFPLHY